MDKERRNTLVAEYLGRASEALNSANKAHDQKMREQFEELARGWQMLAEAILKQSM